MIITRLELTNFMPYEETELIFKKPDDGNRIYLIHGENEFGKTSILKALKWILYGEKDNQERYDLINENALKTGGVTKGVLEFEDDGKSYSLSRTIKYDKNPDVKDVDPQDPNLLVEGTPVEKKSRLLASEVIESIIPEAASEFYFFNAADIGKYAQDNPSEHVRKALHTFLGLDIIDQTVEDFDRVEKDIKDLYEEATDEKDKYSQLVQDINRLEETKREKVEKKKSLERTIENGEHNKTELEKRLEEEKEGEEAEKKLKELRKKRKEKEEKIEEIRTQLNQYKREYYLLIIKRKIRESTSICGEKEKELWERVREGTTDFVEQEILKELVEGDRERCICGATVKGQQLEELREKLDEYNDNDDWQQAHEEKIQLTNIRESLENAQSRLIKLQTVSRLREKTGDLLTDIRRINKEIQDQKQVERTSGIATVEELRKQIDALEEQLRQREAKKLNAKQDIERINSDIQSKRRKLSKYSDTDDEIRFLDLLLNICQKLQKTFKNYSEKVVKYKKSALNKLVNEIYKETLHAPMGIRKVKIREDYTFELHHKNGDKLKLKKLSPGGKEVISFSFIMGLNRYAHRNVPLILDTFTGHLDKEHRRSIAKAVTRYQGGQVFIMVHDADLVFGVEDILKENVIQEFNIEHDYKDRISSIKEIKKQVIK